MRRGLPLARELPSHADVVLLAVIQHYSLAGNGDFGPETFLPLAFDLPLSLALLNSTQRKLLPGL